jgi:hypothetical protein
VFLKTKKIPKILIFSASLTSHKSTNDRAAAATQKIYVLLRVEALIDGRQGWGADRQKTADGKLKIESTGW